MPTAPRHCLSQIVWSKWAPSMAVFNGRLYVAFISNDANNQLLGCSSADGANWSANEPIA